MNNLFKNNIYTEIPLNNIVPNSINPNRMPKGTFNKLKKSLKKFGQLNPIIVRKKEKKYEIIDGEWRWRAAKEINMPSLQCRVIEASDEDVAKLIFATTIKGKNDMYKASNIVFELSKKEDNDTLKACNLDRARIERQTKYHKSSKAHILRSVKDERDTSGVYDIKDYKNVLIITLPHDKYEKVCSSLRKIDKDISKALIRLLDIKEVE